MIVDDEQKQDAIERIEEARAFLRQWSGKDLTEEDRVLIERGLRRQELEDNKS